MQSNVIMTEKPCSKVASSFSVPVLCLLLRARVSYLSKVHLDAECCNEQEPCQVSETPAQRLDAWQVFSNCAPQTICVE